LPAVVTSHDVTHADRYARAEEFMTAVKALWDSWADDRAWITSAMGAWRGTSRQTAVARLNGSLQIVDAVAIIPIR
jgi:alkanesulfonate monooxygenase SsuD/methylene tetrahydromethanopterin reductase-like flavin-dependent oxidoreductase (luciferase family)